MTLVRDLPVELDRDAARLGDYDREGVIRLFREYEFRTLIERLPALSGERAEETVEALRTADAGEPIRAAQVAGRPTGWGPAPAGGARAAGGSLIGQGTGLQLSLDFGAMDGAAAAAGGGEPATGSATVPRATTRPGRAGGRPPERPGRGDRRPRRTDRAAGGRRNRRPRALAGGPAVDRRRTRPRRPTAARRRSPGDGHRRTRWADGGGRRTRATRPAFATWSSGSGHRSWPTR